MDRDDDMVITLADLPDTQVFPPRRGLFDFLPGWLVSRIRSRFQVKPTPYEQWVVRNVFLRATFRGLYRKFIQDPPAAIVDPTTGKERIWN